MAAGLGRVSPLVFVPLVLLACFAVAPRLEAASCGGATPCNCGDTVTSNYLLGGNLGPCSGHGLVVKSNVVLDCRGFQITGLGGTSEQYGISLSGKPGAEISGATVKGCRVSRFHRGIRLHAASSNLIADNTATDNGDQRDHVGYGIDVSGGSHNNVLENNRVHGNADEGIHIGTGSHKNRFVGNTSADNYRENLYLLLANGNVFVRNTLGPGRGRIASTSRTRAGICSRAIRSAETRRGSWATRTTTSSSTTRSRGRACISSPTRAPHAPRATTG